MQFQLNGKTEDMPSGSSFGELLEKFKLKPQQVAVAKNGEVLLRSQLKEIRINEGDQVEIFHAVGGG